MDDFVERLLKTLALICAGFVLIYVLIAMTDEKPTGLSLVIYKSMNGVFLWLFRFFVIGLMGLMGFVLVTRHQEAKKDKERLMLEESEKQKRMMEDRQRKEEEERQKKLEDERRRQAKQKKELENLKRLKERESYLRNRSAEEANKDALKNFL